MMMWWQVANHTSPKLNHNAKPCEVAVYTLASPENAFFLLFRTKRDFLVSKNCVFRVDVLNSACSRKAKIVVVAGHPHLTTSMHKCPSDVWFPLTSPDYDLIQLLGADP